jgi:hypothetical protein
MKKIFFFIIFLGTSLVNSNGQEIVGMSSRYDETFSVWDIYDDSEAVIGEFSQRWQLNNDWTEWDIRYGDVIGSARQKWKNDNSKWELRLDGETITIKMHYPNDPNNWIITDNNVSIDYSTRYPYNTEQWQTESKQFGKFSINMYYEKDPRDWEVFDELDEKISPAMRLSMLFITVMVSAPKK